MRRFGPWQLVCGTICTVGLSTAPVRAASKAECATSHGEAQRLRKSGALVEARQQLLVCNDNSCPDLIKSDCARWLEELNAQLPSIVVAAKGPDGQDSAQVRVFVDGQLATEKLDGRPILINPGPHQLRFELEGEEPIQRRVVIQEGVRARPIDVSFTHDTKPPPPTERARTDDGAGIGWAVAGWTTFALAVGAYGGFAGFGMAGLEGKSELEDGCGSTPAGCNDDDRAPTEEKLLAADIFLGSALGLSALSAGMLIYYYVSQPEDGEAANRWRLDVAPGIDGSLFGQLTLGF